MSAEKRSALMSRIRGKDTRPELLVRRSLWRAGFRYRLQARELPGKPDLVLPKWKAAVFVHGCFWHRHNGCAYFRLPRTRPQFWDTKLRRNSDRDAGAISRLMEEGWRVAVVWECALRANADKAGEILAAWISAGQDTIEITGSRQMVHHHPFGDRVD
ncbi:very short patch repair endonuclease [Rhodanobacter aciditrophus]|uniref:very short patch repair endonuclease n=1 Tax=Rhodanobacter aciditrophus TaxID=1623218 RepID=UPI003CEDF80F